MMRRLAELAAWACLLPGWSQAADPYLDLKPWLGSWKGNYTCRGGRGTVEFEVRRTPEGPVEIAFTSVFTYSRTRSQEGSEGTATLTPGKRKGAYDARVSLHTQNPALQMLGLTQLPGSLTLSSGSRIASFEVRPGALGRAMRFSVSGSALLHAKLGFATFRVNSRVAQMTDSCSGKIVQDRERKRASAPLDKRKT